MTEKQLRFADYYIQTGNATEAAKKAGYNEKSARQIGAENLSKPYILAYIEERLSSISASRIADAQEVLEVFSSVLRGTVKDSDGSPVSVHDRLDAGKALLRRFERLEDRQTEADILAQAKEVLGIINSVIY